MAGCGADTEANELINTLTSDANFPIPEVDLSGPDFEFPAGVLQHSVTPITLQDITNGNVDGPGVFDTLMRGFKAHLQQEWDDGRITGDDYTKAYIALTGEAMTQGVAFLLQKDQSYWQSLLIQVQAFSARVSLETTKVQLAEAQYGASTQKANYALAKMQTAAAEMTYCTGKYNLDNVLPKQVENLTLQGAMIKEQTEAQRAQTLDVRQDGQEISGLVGKQKGLYSQQVISYQRDAEVKAAKIFSDAWITQKTIDEGLLPPDAFNNASVNEVLGTIKTKNGLGG